METAIWKILHGKSSAEYFVIPERYKELSAESVKLYDEIVKEICEKQKDKLDNLFNLEMEMHAIMGKEYYGAGLKLGLQLGAEVFRE